MLRCISLKSESSTTSVIAANHVASLQGSSRVETPVNSPSATVNLSCEYRLAIQTNSYNEIWSKIQVPEFAVEQKEAETENNHEVTHHQRLSLEQVLQPNRKCVTDALSQAIPNTLTHLVSTYFDHSENTCSACLILLHNSIDQARIIYAKIKDLVEILPHDSNSLTQAQCQWAFDTFLKFDSAENPFPSADFHNFEEMRACFSQLRKQLDHWLGKSRSRIRAVQCINAGSAFCFIGTVVGVAISAIVITGHAVVALVAGGSFLPAALLCPPRTRLMRKEVAHLAQLDAADKCIYVLNNDLDTIDRLVASLYTAVESDKHLIRIGLEGGCDRYSIFEVVKQLRKNYLNVVRQFKDLEEHICLCFVAINRARSLLLQEILVHQSQLPVKHS